MKPESIKVRRHLNDKDRDGVLKLLVCGLPTDEIVSLTSISRSTICNIRQAHTACLERDWSTLQRLSTCVRPTVDWAMKVTGVDKVFLEEFPKDDEPESVTGPTVDNTPEPAPISHEEFMAMWGTLQDIRSLLTEIRDVLK